MANSMKHTFNTSHHVGTPGPRVFVRGAPVFMVVMAVAYILLGLFSEYWLGVITGHDLGGDFKIYYEALLTAREGRNPYEPYDIGDSFIYHPFALSFVSVVAMLGSYSSALWGWIIGSLIAWGVAIWLTLRTLAGHHPFDRLSPAQQLWGGFLFLGFAPLWETLHIGQVNAFVVLALSGAVYFSERGHQWAAGLALSWAAVLKTSPVLLIFFFLASRQHRAVVAAVMGLLVTSALAALQFTPRILWDFVAMMPQLGREIHPTPYNQSVLSLFFRSLAALDLPVNSWAPAFVAGHKALFALLFGMLVVVATVKPPRGSARLVLFGAMWSAVVFFSSLVWYHHAALLLFPLGALIWHPEPRHHLTGLALLFLLQSDRLFEQTVIWKAFPALVAEATLLLLWLRWAMWPQAGSPFDTLQQPRQTPSTSP